MRPEENSNQQLSAILKQMDMHRRPISYLLDYAYPEERAYVDIGTTRFAVFLCVALGRHPTPHVSFFQEVRSGKIAYTKLLISELSRAYGAVHEFA